MNQDLKSRVKEVFKKGKAYFEHEDGVEMYEIIEKLTPREAKLVAALKIADAQFGCWVCSSPEDAAAQKLIRTTLKELSIGDDDGE